jgi:hypothetical protein
MPAVQTAMSRDLLISSTKTGQTRKVFDKARERVCLEDLAMDVGGNPAEGFEGAVLCGFVVAARLGWLKKIWPFW